MKPRKLIRFAGAEEDDEMRKINRWYGEHPEEHDPAKPQPRGTKQRKGHHKQDPFDGLPDDFFGW